jgi:hypothetical protein
MGYPVYLDFGKLVARLRMPTSFQLTFTALITTSMYSPTPLNVFALVPENAGVIEQPLVNAGVDSNGMIHVTYNGVEESISVMIADQYAYSQTETTTTISYLAASSYGLVTANSGGTNNPFIVSSAGAPVNTTGRVYSLYMASPSLLNAQGYISMFTVMSK